jgi:hypothetical protein
VSSPHWLQAMFVAGTFFGLGLDKLIHWLDARRGRR